MNSISVNFYFLLFSILLHTVFHVSAESIETHSPEGNLILRLSARDGHIHATLFQQSSEILKTRCGGYTWKNQRQLPGFKILSHSTTHINTADTPAYGPFKTITIAYSELQLNLLDTANNLPCTLRFRLFNVGMGFRYEYPNNHLTTALKTELTFLEPSPALPQGQRTDSCWWAWADYNTLEKTYQHTPAAQTLHAASPLTVKTSSGNYLYFHEAAVKNFTTLTWRKTNHNTTQWQANLVPGADSIAVHTSGAFTSPWRVAGLGTSAGKLAESNLLYALNEPGAIHDKSWIKPIRYVGIWWEMHLGLATWKLEGGRHGATEKRVREYIDFAAQNGIEGVLVEGWNKGWENWGQQGSFDFLQPYPDYPLAQLVAYAKSKGVEIIMHHETGGDWQHYESQMEKAFAQCEKLGIHYVKTGYAGGMLPAGESHHGQVKVEHLQRVTEAAARYHLMVDAHEPVMPSGLSRTWPNLMTFEAVRGNEWNAWSNGNFPEHHCTLPFTRGLAGAMDYTPGILDILLEYQKEKREKWNAEDKGNSRIHTTMAHQMALPVIFYSPMQMLADLPENYASHPDLFNLLKNIPATWDSTCVLGGIPGEYIITARKGGSTWFVAGITNSKGRNVELNLNPLVSGKNTATLCKDGAGANAETNPLAYKIIDNITVGKGDKTRISMAPGGGFLLILRQN